MSTFAPKLQRVRSSIIRPDPWVFGMVEVQSNLLKLFFVEKDNPNKAHIVTLDKDIAIADLDCLTAACEPAGFGLGNEDVFDETYRKAGKMEKTAFASLFDLHEAKILQKALPKLLQGPNADVPVNADLYKLNIYGKGSFFRSHKDTPRSEKMFGSLVVIFPTPHEGGALALRHDDKEFVFETSDISVKHGNNVAYIVFFSDVEHEVLPVTDGHRITLTYNLYYNDDPLPSSFEDIFQLRNSLSGLLDDATFLPHGGYLGFGLNFAYPVVKGSESFDTVTARLKGSDELVRSACTELGLQSFVRGIAEIQECRCYHIMFPAPHDYRSGTVDFIPSFLMGSGGEFIHSMGEEPNTLDRFEWDIDRLDYYSKQVAWITPVTEYSKFETTYMYGNESSLLSYYANVSLMVPIGPAGERDNTDAYEGEHVYVV